MASFLNVSWGVTGWCGFRWVVKPWSGLSESFFFRGACSGEGDVAFANVFFFSSRRRHTRSYGDWSSDVCSSDLPGESLVEAAPVQRFPAVDEVGHVVGHVEEVDISVADNLVGDRDGAAPCVADVEAHAHEFPKIGRASCRERVEISGGGGSLKRQ